MLRKLGSLLFMLVCAVCSARGDIIAGPITLGFPGDPNGFLPEFNVYVTPIPGILLSGGPTGSSENSSFTFDFNLAPGWMVTGVRVSDFIDFGTSQTDFNNWGYEYLQEVGLCTSEDVCSTGSASGHAGGASLPSLAPIPQIGPNQGFYYLSAYSLNTQVMTDGNTGSLVINLAQVPPVPEPRTMLLLSTGILGLAFLRRPFRGNERS